MKQVRNVLAYVSHIPEVWGSNPVKTKGFLFQKKKPIYNFQVNWSKQYLNEKPVRKISHFRAHIFYTKCRITALGDRKIFLIVNAQTFVLHLNLEQNVFLLVFVCWNAVIFVICSN